ncbi:hypothetical protein [Enterococcus sp. DIV0660C]|uniref:hypothetical protein n=1 Tax=Enterococcus sp. DIV0660C TaxID=2230880 RepID=UPI001A8ED66F|nr:hypothetical protein [Enterococcus sp. DIV0660C]MBO0430945.1 hypothetical protein [Enterococcus sp. DIV0660C]
MSKKEYSNKQETMFKIELVQAFVERFGLKSNIVLRIAEELATILADFPFTAAEIQTVSKQLPAVEHVYFHGNNEVDVSVVEKNWLRSF